MRIARARLGQWKESRDTIQATSKIAFCNSYESP
jgi:hypothetical protein